MNNDDQKTFGEVFKKLGTGGNDQSAEGNRSRDLGQKDNDQKNEGSIFDKMGITGKENPEAGGIRRDNKNNNRLKDDEDEIFRGTRPPIDCL